MNEDVVVQLRDIRKTYNPGGLAVHVLKGISFSIHRGQFVGIVGTSGSGKSTMLNILGMLDVPTSGDYFLEKVNVATLSDSAQATVRNIRIGFIFQSFNLFPYLTIEQNIEVPMICSMVRYGNRLKLWKMNPMRMFRTVACALSDSVATFTFSRK